MSSIRCIISLLVLAIAAVMMPVTNATGAYGNRPPPQFLNRPGHPTKKGAQHGGPPLAPEDIKCGEFIPGADINVGMGNLEPVGSLTVDDHDCKDLCDHVPTCNAAIRIADGRCYLKSVEKTDVPVKAAGMNLWLRCW